MYTFPYLHYMMCITMHIPDKTIERPDIWLDASYYWLYSPIWFVCNPFKTPSQTGV